MTLLLVILKTSTTGLDEASQQVATSVLCITAVANLQWVQLMPRQSHKACSLDTPAEAWPQRFLCMRVCMRARMCVTLHVRGKNRTNFLLAFQLHLSQQLLGHFSAA